MVAHLIKNQARCENASDEAVNAALAIKYPNEKISAISSRHSTRPRLSSDASDSLNLHPKN